MLPNNPSAPPTSEISTDSLNTCRRMRLQLDPSASRKATSRERSAARAANRLPRLAQAASRIKAASNINPVTNAFTGPPRKSPADPPWDPAEIIALDLKVIRTISCAQRVQDHFIFFQGIQGFAQAGRQKVNPFGDEFVKFQLVKVLVISLTRRQFPLYPIQTRCQ
jgi:hypothetical protein